MCYILCIESSTEICSVALAKQNQLLAIKENSNGNTHAEQLMPFVDAILSQTGINTSQINAVCISEGPGSYTGLRIGTSTAKGLCFALNIPLIAINTLQTMAWGARKLFPDKPLFCPMIDARRMEVYCAIFDNELKTVVGTQSKIIEPDTFSDILNQQTMVFSGNGAEKCKNVLPPHPSIIYAETKTSAAYMIDLAYQKYNKQKFENLAYFEPFYLKEFIPGKPRVKGL
ncbi:MAG: tRNA (adenosine(37)-N6)-threonylcarbamoyltransferase complex dimerization subunit type 1 TsaB [Bacteroidales bacterium]|jgi:tRNA threonylcarbamoyladenosine biosynthesis protein TsaB|nr:tRNA (adenosine(37)-N6)-threonylcarbamoyltransferase complex dimerization subunit type 1 TsaB [Bacteroidales bacterium]